MAPRIRRKGRSHRWSRRDRPRRADNKTGSSDYAYDANDAGEPMLSWAQAQQTVKLSRGTESERFTISDELDIRLDMGHYPTSKTKNLKKPLPFAEFDEVDSLQKSIDKVLPPPDAQQEAYVCDEEDHEMLRMVNGKKSFTEHGKLTVGAFEDAITLLERESTKCRGPNTSFTLPVDEDAVCSVCQKGDCDNTNMILFCDMCNLAVHQECYGVPYIPEGQWHCRRCMVSPSRPAQCQLCPTSEGALKQTEDGHWAHVICALYIPKVSFKSPQLLEPIMNIDKIEKSRYKLKCVVCKSQPGYVKGSQVGACIQCEEPTCKTAFHVTCAQKAGYFLDLKPIQEESDSSSRNIGEKEGVQAIAYCEKHSRNQTRKKVLKKKKKDSLSPSSRSVTSCKTQQQTRMDSLNIDSDKLLQIAKSVKLDSNLELFTLILTYWKSKRKHRNGLPLLKRPKGRTVAQRAANHEELDRLRKFIIPALQRTEKLRTLTEYQLRKDRNDFRRDKLLDIKLGFEAMPAKSVISHVFDRIKALDKEGYFAHPVTDKIAPRYSELIARPMDFSTMRKRMDASAYVSFEEFADDIRLIVSNCLKYNTPDTIFHQFALTFHEAVLPILEEGARDYADFVGCRRELPAFSVFELTSISLSTSRPLSHLLNGNREAFLSENSSSGEDNDQKTEVEIEPVKLVEVSPAASVSNSTVASSSPVNSRAIPTSPRSRKTPIRTESAGVSNIDDSNDIDGDSGPARKRMRTTPAESEETAGSSSRVPTPATEIPAVPIALKAYRNGRLIALASESEPDFPFVSEDSTDLQSSDCDLDSDGPARRLRNRQHNSNREREYMEYRAGDFVWAKNTQVYYPAIVVDPKAIKGYRIGELSVPAIPADLISDRREKKSNVYLVNFLDHKRTWSWVEKEKLEFVNLDYDKDQIKLNEPRKDVERRNVKKAYDLAIQSMNDGFDMNGIGLHEDRRSQSSPMDRIRSNSEEV